MKKCIFLIALLASLVAAAPRKPKLVLTIVVDQFRYDYLTRFRSEYHAGFDRLLTKGAVFANARYEQFPTVTAVGHSIILSGATPSISGIINNDWYDRESQGKVTSVSDDKTTLVGGTGPGSSPHRLLVDTLGDELKIASGGKSKVFGISLKDRAAILPAGHSANGAFWFDVKSGNFVSSTYYFQDLPGWVAQFNASRPADQYAGMKWLSRTITTDKTKLYSAIDSSPFGNDIVEALAERALESEHLGQQDATDLLSVSFSANDYVGHSLGPDSPEVHEMCVRTDVLFEKLFQAVDKLVGLDNVLIVMTADHGVAPMPEMNAKRKMPGGRMPLGIVSRTVQEALVARFGKGEWIVSDSEHSLYFNQPLIAQKKIDRAQLDRVAAQAILSIPHVFRVYTREQLMSGAALEDQVGRRVMNGYFGGRGADVEVLLEPYWIFSQTGTTHGTTFSYDSHVPVIFMGPGVRPGRYTNPIAINDIAPTLATILDVEIPAGSVGRPLSEIIE
jgi:predicted AlkP superfamily pyrophosphatase or phosphodiesterase